MTNTPTRIVIHWPDTDLSSILSDRGPSRMVLAILKEIPQNPFQQGRDLTSEGTTTELVSNTDSSGSYDPGRELYASAGGADD